LCGTGRVQKNLTIFCKEGGDQSNFKKKNSIGGRPARKSCRKKRGWGGISQEAGCDRGGVTTSSGEKGRKKPKGRTKKGGGKFTSKEGNVETRKLKSVVLLRGNKSGRDV